MKKTNRPSLSLQRTTVRNLSGSELSSVDGGNFQSIIVLPPTSIFTGTRNSLVDGCRSVFCPPTLDTSVINPIPFP